MIKKFLNNLLFFYIIKMVGDDMNTIIIICLLVALIGSIIIVFIVNYNKFQWLIIKLNKGENSISNYLNQKHSILVRYVDILKESIEINSYIEEYKNIDTKLSINDLNQKVNDFNNLINGYLDNNEKLLKKEAIVNINKELKTINIALNGAKKYYNDNLIIYNHLCHKFPALLVAKLFKYKDKDFQDELENEEFKILNDEEKD